MQVRLEILIFGTTVFATEMWSSDFMMLTCCGIEIFDGTQKTNFIPQINVYCSGLKRVSTFSQSTQDQKLSMYCSLPFTP